MSDKKCISPLATRPLLYTDTLDGKQVCRDDLWAVTTNELNAAAAGCTYPTCGPVTGEDGLVETPRTDEYSNFCHVNWFPDEYTCNVLRGWTSFGRQLERELIAAEARAKANQQDAERWQFAQVNGFPVRNQTASHDGVKWIATRLGSAQAYAGPTPNAAIDAARGGKP